jgi:hypothetical protein
MTEVPGGPQADYYTGKGQNVGVDMEESKNPNEFIKNQFAAPADGIADHFRRLDTLGILVKRQNRHLKSVTGTTLFSRNGSFVAYIDSATWSLSPNLRRSE